MEIQLVRHATLVVRLGGRTLLIDPMLGDLGEFRSFLIDKSEEPTCNYNPIARLSDDPGLSSILASVEAIFVTHAQHRDHFDLDLFEQHLKQEAPGTDLLKAIDRLKALPVFCQPLGEGQQQSDEDWLRDHDFSSVQSVEDKHQYDGIKVFRTDGKHGPNNELGPVSGFVLRAENEPTLYIAGDTIWCPEVAVALEMHKPEVVVVNAGAAQMYATPPAITMTKKDVAKVCKHMPSATVVAVHMEAIDHCLLRRKELEDFIEGEGLRGQVRIPADGESMKFRGRHLL